MGNVCGSTATEEGPVAKGAAQPAAPASAPAPVAKDAPPTATAIAATPAPPAAQQAAAAPGASKKATIYIIFYSTYGHILKMAEVMAEAINASDVATAKVFQVPEILPKDILEKMHAPPKSDYPIIEAKQLTDADGLIFGFPTRFGMMASQMKSFLDSTGGLWQSGALHGKPATMFTSSATQGGGQETTIWSAVTQLAHHGMLYVPPGYAAGGIMFGVDKAKGGSPYGAGTLAAPDGSRQPSEEELEAATVQGKGLATVAKKLAA